MTGTPIQEPLFDLPEARPDGGGPDVALSLVAEAQPADHPDDWCGWQLTLDEVLGVRKEAA